MEKLTKPLVVVHGDDDPSLLQDDFPADNHNQSNTLHSSHPLVFTMALPSALRQGIEATHIQKETPEDLV